MWDIIHQSPTPESDERMAPGMERLIVATIGRWLEF